MAETIQFPRRRSPGVRGGLGPLHPPMEHRSPLGMFSERTIRQQLMFRMRQVVYPALQGSSGMEEKGWDHARTLERTQEIASARAAAPPLHPGTEELLRLLSYFKMMTNSCPWPRRGVPQREERDD